MNKTIQLVLFSLLLAFVFSDTAIVTYHLYKKTDSLTTVSCSDGANGIMSWGYRDLSMLFPYVTAWQPSSWNSPQCGSCAKIMWKGKYTYVTVIDQCGVINSAYSHFDMSKEAFYGLFGDVGIAKGTMTANFSIVASKYCPGNRKGVIGESPFPWQSQTQEQTPQFEQQQNLRGEDSSQYQNPLWTKGASTSEQKLNFQPSNNEDEEPSPRVSQQSQGYQNPLWVKGQNQWEPNTEVGTTEWGGFSYDKQNEINENQGV